MDILKSRRRFLQGLAAASVYGPLSQFGLARMALAGQAEQSKLKVVLVVVDTVASVSFFLNSLLRHLGVGRNPGASAADVAAAVEEHCLREGVRAFKTSERSSRRKTD